MSLKVGTRWKLDETEVDARVVPLLRAIARDGSLNRAVAAVRLSYRHAWGLIGATERVLGNPLVVMERGRGAHLTPFANQLIEIDDTAAGVLERELGPMLQALARPALVPRGALRGRPLAVHASHDLALAALRDLLADDGSTRIDLRFRGSLDSLSDLANGPCEVAGFHLPADPACPADFDPYRPLLRGRALRVIHFVTRRQGFILARGNPRGIRAFSDLADRRGRFVNRQQGSGTRLAIDALLAREGVGPERISGYEKEEFTHAAVAATVASGMADAGFGIEAAAREHGLDFVAVATERYFLALRAGTLKTGALTALLECMGSAAFRRALDALPGYSAPDIGRIALPREILP